MLFMNPAERALSEAVGNLAYTNPFLPERVELERQGLGDEFVDSGSVWHVQVSSMSGGPNSERLFQKAAPLAETLRTRLVDAETREQASRDELMLYEDLVLYTLYHEFEAKILDTMQRAFKRQAKESSVDFYEEFESRYHHFLEVSRLKPRQSCPRIFSVFFQIRRAFFHIFFSLIGSSMPMARLRAAIWQSIFTHDIRRYQQVLFDGLRDMSTLITGPSGTGKELVARAIGLSRYIPFNPSQKKFNCNIAGSFYPLNLSALSSTLIESELFGHRRGSFTGALEDHVGWFERCVESGCVFLDEIGELDAGVQVKLLRVLQSRTFQRIGDTQNRAFHGKIISATNRDLTVELAEGRFREDLYYRLCSDTIRTPSLAEQLEANPDELFPMLLFIARQIVDSDTAQELAEECADWIGENLGVDYCWPGNFRELEQCVRNLLIRGEYRPAHRGSGGGWSGKLFEELRTAQLTVDDLVRKYCTIAYARVGNYEGTARILNIDRRTVKAKIDTELLDEIRADQVH